MSESFSMRNEISLDEAAAVELELLSFAHPEHSLPSSSSSDLSVRNFRWGGKLSGCGNRQLQGKLSSGIIGALFETTGE
jgi:hypothetical protein